MIKELPGMAGVITTIEPGKTVGSSVIQLTTSADKRLSANVYVNNHNNYYASPTRFGVQVAANNFLLKKAEKLVLTIEKGKGSNTLAALQLEKPFGYSGFTFGTKLTDSRYQITDSSLENLGLEGSSNSFSLYGNYPWLRDNNKHVNLKAAVETNLHKDLVKSTNTEKKSTVNLLKVSADGLLKQKLSNANIDVSATVGNLDFSDKETQELDEKGASVQGGFAKLEASLYYDYKFSHRLNLTTNVNGQLALNNLDGSQKMSLGGLSGVRGYPNGEASGDTGVVANIGLNYSLLSNLKVGVGYDRGFINNHDSNESMQTRQGFATYISGNYKGINLDATVASRIGDKATSSPDENPRLWLKLNRNF